MVHASWMTEAVKQGQMALQFGQRPFGTVIVKDNRVVATAHGTETPLNPTRHSEIQAIKKACQAVGGLLHGCTMYQTLEPCGMCCYAINHAKISRVVWGATRADFPALFRQRDYGAEELLKDTSHPPEVRVGVLRGPCIALFADELPWHPEHTIYTPGVLDDGINYND